MGNGFGSEFQLKRYDSEIDYKNKSDQVKICREDMLSLESEYPIKIIDADVNNNYNSSDIGVYINGRAIDKVFCVKTGTQYNIPIVIGNNTTPTYCLDTSSYYNTFYGIGLVDGHYPENAMVNIRPSSSKEYSLGSFKNKGESVLLNQLDLSGSIYLTKYRPKPFIRKFPTKTRLNSTTTTHKGPYDGSIYRYNPTDVVTNNQGNILSTTYNWRDYGVAATNYQTRFLHSFAIDYLIRPWNWENEEEPEDLTTHYKDSSGRINVNNLHTSKITPELLTDRYAGSNGLGYSKKWSGFVVELYYHRERTLIGNSSITGSPSYKYGTTYNLYAKTKFIGMDPEMYSYRYGYTSLDSENVTNNWPQDRYGSLPSEFDYGSKLGILNKAQIYTNVPPMINIELQAGGGPGASPLSTTLYKNKLVEYQKRYNSTSNLWKTNMQLLLPGGGSGAYGEFSIYMTENFDKPQIVIYVGAGGLADDCRWLNGYEGSNQSRAYTANIYRTFVGMDGFSSMLIANNISFELEGGCNGTTNFAGKMPNNWKDVYNGSSLGTVSFKYDYGNIVENSDSTYDESGNCGAINTAVGSSNTVGVIVPLHLFNGSIPDTEFWTQDNNTSVNTSYELNVNYLTPLPYTSYNYNNKIKLTSNYKYSLSSGEVDISDRIIHHDEAADDGIYYPLYRPGHLGFYHRYTSLDSKVAYNMKDWYNTSKTLGMFYGGGGAPSIASSGGRGGNCFCYKDDAESDRQVSTITISSNKIKFNKKWDQNADSNMALLTNSNIMHGYLGSGGGGGAAFCLLYGSDSDVLNISKYSDFGCVHTSTLTDDCSIRGGDGGSGFFNIIF